MRSRMNPPACPRPQHGRGLKQLMGDHDSVRLRTQPSTKAACRWPALTGFAGPGRAAASCSASLAGSATALLPRRTVRGMPSLPSWPMRLGSLAHRWRPMRCSSITADAARRCRCACGGLRMAPAAFRAAGSFPCGFVSLCGSIATIATIAFDFTANSRGGASQLSRYGTQGLLTGNSSGNLFAFG